MKQLRDGYNKRGFKVKYLPCTNTKPARFSITDTRHKDRRVFSVDYRVTDIMEQAWVELAMMGIECKTYCYDEMLLLTEDFQTRIYKGYVK